MKFHFKHFNETAFTLAVDRDDEEIIKPFLSNKIMINTNATLEKKTGNYHRLWYDGIQLISILGPPEGYIVKDNYLVQIDDEDITYVFNVFLQSIL